MSDLSDLLSGAGFDVSGHGSSNDVVSGRVESDLVKLWQDRESIVEALRGAKRVLRSDVKLGVKIESMADVAKSPLNYSSPDVARIALADVFCWTGLLDNSFFRRVCSDLADFYFSPSVSDVECASDLCGPSFQVFLMRVCGLEVPADFIAKRQQYFSRANGGYAVAERVESDLVRLWQDRAVMRAGKFEAEFSGFERLAFFEGEEGRADRDGSNLNYSFEAIPVVLIRAKSCIELLKSTDMAPLYSFYKKVFDDLESFYDSESD